MTDENEKQAEQAEAAAQAEVPSAQLGIQKIYVKDVSFEAPNSPKVFTEEWKPTVDIQLNNNARTLEKNVHEVVLAITVTVKFADKTVYLVEVHQAGIFNISGVPEQHLPAMAATVCPNILFPYAREAISDLVTRGGFPQLLLAPVNFDALYSQEMQRQQAAAAGSEATPAVEDAAEQVKH
jgi:preprotein translocase subunit SecB